LTTITSDTRPIDNGQFPAPADGSFLAEVIRDTPGECRLDMCIQCGTCGGSCPSGADMEHTPRQLFAMIRAGMEEEVLASNTPWYCVSCYYCMVRCPQEIHITDIMYTLKRRAIGAGLYRESSAADAPDFSETFLDYVEEYGRSFELGLATRYHLRHHPLDAVRKAGSLGLGLLRKGRLDLAPHRIAGIEQLQSILAAAREIGE
jgi:heterodisulfide reductase subunit C2